MLIKRGDVYLADIEVGIGSEQYGARPVLIIQNNMGNRHSPTTIVALLSSRKKREDLPVHVTVHGRQELYYDSCVMLEQIKTVSVKCLSKYICTLSESEMKKIDTALKISLGMKNKVKGNR